MSFYGDLQNLTEDLLDEFGGNVSFVQRTKNAYSVTTGQTWTDSTTTKKAVLTKFRKVGSQVEEGSFLLIAENLFDFTPDTEDQIIIDGDTFEIKKIWPINPGLINMLYRFKVEKGAE